MLWTVRSLLVPRNTLVLENLALRQQLAVATQGGRRPRLCDADRMFWVALRQMWSDWAASFVAWHRVVYRAYWRRISRKRGRPNTDTQVRALIRRMVAENHWGAPRIHGELLKLGVQVSERTVSRYLRACRRKPPPGTSWKTFLSNHREVLTAMDFITVPTVTFRLLYVLFIIQHRRRKILHFNVTQHPDVYLLSGRRRRAALGDGSR